MKKRIVFISIVSIAVTILLVLAFVFISGNQITMTRCIVTDNDSLYMVFGDRPIHLTYDREIECQTGDKLLIIHQSQFAESYPEQTRAYFVMKIGSGSKEDIPEIAFDILIDTGNWSE